MPERDDITARLSRIKATIGGLAEEVRAVEEELALLGFPGGSHAATRSASATIEDETGSHTQGNVGAGLPQSPVPVTGREDGNKHKSTAGQVPATNAGGGSTPSAEGRGCMPEVEQVSPQSATAPTPRVGSDEAAELVVVIDRKSSRMTERQVDALNPVDFDLFLDDVRGLVGGRAVEGGKLVRPAAIGIQPADLYVLRTLMEHQGWVCTGSEFREIGDPEDNRRAVTNHVCRLRSALGDDAKHPRLIMRAMNSHSVYTKGMGYSLAVDIRCCLVTLAGTEQLADK